MCPDHSAFIRSPYVVNIRKLSLPAHLLPFLLAEHRGQVSGQPIGFLSLCLITPSEHLLTWAPKIVLPGQLLTLLSCWIMGRERWGWERRDEVEREQGGGRFYKAGRWLHDSASPEGWGGKVYLPGDDFYLQKQITSTLRILGVAICSRTSPSLPVKFLVANVGLRSSYTFLAPVSCDLPLAKGSGQRLSYPFE